MTEYRFSVVALGAVTVVAAAACGGGASLTSSPEQGSPPKDGGVVAPSDGAATASADASLDGGPAAATATATTSSVCTAIPNFYWEVGNVSGALVAGVVGSGFDATTTMNIASASKFVFSAYVIERFASDLTQMDESLTRMLGGYTGFSYDTCVLSTSVAACASAATNATVTATAVGHFYYNGGDFQSYAANALGLGADTKTELAADIKALVGTEFAFTYSSPQLAGGINTSASDYAAFLRKILAGNLALHDHLGENAVCTLPGASCPTALYSPAAPHAWHYSYAHWVEDDPTTGDGAFSSAGAFGFYPWIDATKTYYGIVARYSLDSGAYIQSAECGAAIRKAFVTGVVQ